MNMTVGEKIKKLRNFRKMTQADLGAALGWGDKGANRIAQYETGYRVPKKEVLCEMAKILDVNHYLLLDPTYMNASDYMYLLFWIDEFNPGVIHLNTMEPYPNEKWIDSDDISLRYQDTYDMPTVPPVALWFNYSILNGFLKEWEIRKRELKAGEITKDEYFEWKINWPQTCDDCGKIEPHKKWRNTVTE